MHKWSGLDRYGNHGPPTSVVTDGKWVYMGAQGENGSASAAISMEGDILRWLAKQRIVAGRDMSPALDDQWRYDLTCAGG